MIPPLPAPNPDTQEFWDGCRRHELRIQRCDDCGTHRFTPRPACPSCASLRFAWITCGGRGVVHTWTVIHGPTLPAFAEKTPYAAGVVRLDEGVFMVGNVLDCPPEAVAVGMPVEVEITDVEPGLRLPLFRVAR